MTLHYTASSPWGSPEGIAAYQTGPRSHLAFPAVAYHWLVDREGTVYRCHDLQTRTWHSDGVVNGVARNQSHIAVCYIGDDTPNLAQRQGLRQAIAECERELGRRLTVEGHKDASATTCPGPTWPDWRGDILTT